MTDKTGGAAFHWYASSDAERYIIGPCDTRDALRPRSQRLGSGAA